MVVLCFVNVWVSGEHQHVSLVEGVVQKSEAWCNLGRAYQ